MLTGLRDVLVSAVYPQDCRACSTRVRSVDDGVACETCWSSTRIFNGREMLCSKCGAFLSDKAAPVPVLCHQCDDHLYDRAIAVGVYENAFSATIIHLKSTPHLPRQAVKLMEQRLTSQTDLARADVVVPIPLAKIRCNERGYNQADVIGSHVAKILAKPTDRFSLVRVVHTPIHRAGMDRKARELTVKNAFKIVRPNLIDGKNVLLVDDVFTSGATASYCSKVLKKSGATRVDVFTLARAVMK
jgi:ComF family protein